MRTTVPGKRLTIYLGDGAASGGTSLAETIVRRAQEFGIQHASIVRPLLTPGAGPLQSLRAFGAAREGTKVELLGEAALIENFSHSLTDVLTTAVATLELVELIRYDA